MIHHLITLKRCKIADLKKSHSENKNQSWCGKISSSFLQSQNVRGRKWEIGVSRAGKAFDDEKRISRRLRDDMLLCIR